MPTTIRSTDILFNDGTTQSTAAGVPINGPALYAATPNNKSASPNTITEISGYSTPLFDTASCFNTTTGRFTPNVAGFYQFSFLISFATNGIAGPASLVSGSLLKNGGTFWNGGSDISAFSFGMYGGSTVTNMNGTTDFVSVAVFQNTASTVNNFRAVLAGALIRSAT